MIKCYYKSIYFAGCITTGSVAVVVVVLRVLLVYCTALDNRLFRLDAISEFISCNTLSISCRVVSPSLPCRRKQYKILQHEEQPWAYHNFYNSCYMPMRTTYHTKTIITCIARRIQYHENIKTWGCREIILTTKVFESSILITITISKHLYILSGKTYKP